MLLENLCLLEKSYEARMRVYNLTRILARTN